MAAKSLTKKGNCPDAGDGVVVVGIVGEGRADCLAGRTTPRTTAAVTAATLMATIATIATSVINQSIL